MKKILTTAAMCASMAMMALGLPSSWAQSKPAGAGLSNSTDIKRCELHSWLVFPSAGKSKDQIVEAQCGAGPADTAKLNGFPTTNPDRPAWIAGCKSAVRSEIESCTEGTDGYANCLRTKIQAAGAKIQALNKQLKQDC